MGFRIYENLFSHSYYFIVIRWWVICCFFSACSPNSEPIFSYEGDSVVTNSKYITPFYFEKQDSSAFLFKTFVLTSKDNIYSYVLKLSSYKGMENDPGYFHRIEIESEGKTLICLKDTDGWYSLNDSLRKYAANDYVWTVPLSDCSMALVFTGYPFPSEPELVTIVVLHKDRAALVYNHHMMVKSADYDGGSKWVINLQDRFIEYLDEKTPANTAHLYRISLAEGLLKYEGPCATVSE